jgi:hypothetical protein
MRDPDAIARELVQTVVDAEEAQAKADRLTAKADALGRELAPHMPSDVLTIVTRDHRYAEVVVQFSRLQGGDVLAERIDTTRIGQIEWLACDDEPSHPVNPAVDAIDVALIDAEVH